MLNLRYARKFGVEIELNAFSDKDYNELPDGIHHVASVISKIANGRVEVRKHEHTHWRHSRGIWVVKPDISCGMEACSPVCEGWSGIKEIAEVVEAFSEDDYINADESCSLHVHIDVSDLDMEEVANVAKWWIKCEATIMDAMPLCRKRNKFCQGVGLWDWLSHDSMPSAQNLLALLGESKYTSLNAYHRFSGARNTLEFRLGDNSMCRRPKDVKSWIRLLLHFVETTRAGSPEPYVAGEPLTGLSWLDPKDLFKLLWGDRELSPGMSQVRYWLLSRLATYVDDCDDVGLYSRRGRRIARREIREMLKDVPAVPDDLYSKKYKF